MRVRVQGGAANWRAARGYYSGAIEVTKGRSVRALYGVCAAAAQLEGAKPQRGGGGGDEDDGDGGLPGVAAEALLARYGAECEGKLALVKAMLKAQRLL